MEDPYSDWSDIHSEDEGLELGCEIFERADYVFDKPI